MNSADANKKVINLHLLIALLSFSYSLNAILINKTPLSTLLKKNQFLSYTPVQGKNNFIVLEMKNGNLHIGDGSINNLINLKENFENLVSQRDKLSSIETKIYESLNNSIHHNGWQLTAKKIIMFQAKTSICLEHSLVTSPEILLTANEMIFNNCFFINPNQLYLQTTSNNSDYKTLCITFNQAPKHPTAITGNINFTNNETPKALILTNVQKIEIEFAPKAWN